MASRADETAVSDGHPTTADGGTRPRTTCDLAPGDLVGEYRVVEKIGQGGMGVVYGAVHPVIGKRVAIKVLDETRGTQPEAVARFAIEARAVNQIRHPNIVDIFAFGTLADGRSYFAMAWLDGTSLGNRLRAGRPPLAETCAILEEVALALEAAHAQRIVHRDLKPDNIYLGPGPEDRPRVTLLDFGIAKLLDDDDDEARASLTRRGTMVGTPLYISPEQARCGTIDTRADIYALGAVAYQMVTGSPPGPGGVPRGPRAAAVLRQQHHGERGQAPARDAAARGAGGARVAPPARRGAVADAGQGARRPPDLARAARGAGADPRRRRPRHRRPPSASGAPPVARRLGLPGAAVGRVAG